MPLSDRNSERWDSRAGPCGCFAVRALRSPYPTPSARAHSRSAASHHSTTLHMSIEVFWDATASHKSAEGRYKHYERSLLIVVEKREAVKRECARAEGVGLAEGEARATKRPQGHAREPKRSEFNYKPEVDFHLT